MKRLRLLVAAIAAALLGGLALPAAPAQAGLHVEGYAFVDRYGFGSYGYVDIDGIEIWICPQCFEWLDISTRKVLPQEVAAQVQKGLLGGVQKLGKANVARDPAVRQRYLGAALAEFTTVARLVGDDSLVLNQVGYYDAERRATVPYHRDWLAAAGRDLVDGVGLLQRALVEPDPHPWIKAATAEFGEAYQELSTKEVVGG